MGWSINVLSVKNSDYIIRVGLVARESIVQYESPGIDISATHHVIFTLV